MDYYPARIFPSGHETKRQPDPESKSAKILELDKTEEELKRVVEEIAKQERLFWSRHKLNRRLLFRLKRRQVDLLEQDRNLRYKLMTHKERLDLKNRIATVQKELEVLMNKEQNSEEKERDRFLSHQLSELVSQLPDDERRLLERYSWNEIKDLREKLDAVAKECVRLGIEGLSKQLYEIFETTGKLPAAIVYPETSTRPLSYAVRPLLRKIYAQAGQEKPPEFFVKTFSASVDDEGYQQKIEDLEHGLKNLQQWRLGLLKERDDILRQMRKSGVRKTRAGLSQEVEVVSQKIKDADSEMLKLSEKIQAWQKKKDQEVLVERLSVIQDGLSDGPILVIDDVLSTGQTFRYFQHCFDQTGKNRAVFYFAFLSYASSIDKISESIPREDIFVGTAVDRSVLGISEESMEAFGSFSVGDLSPEEAAVWEELYNSGFPFRTGMDKDLPNNQRKEQVSGVVKVRSDFSASVKKSPLAISKSMSRVRKKYQRWGEEALK